MTKKTKTETTITVTITVTHQITDHQLKGILCTAFEGNMVGSWCTIIGYEFGSTGLTYADFQENGKMQNPTEYWHPVQLVPLVDGCSVILCDPEDWDDETDSCPEASKWILNREKIVAGLQVMAEKFPDHFNDFITENDDAVTGDMFLQAVLFGEERYC